MDSRAATVLDGMPSRYVDGWAAARSYAEAERLACYAAAERARWGGMMVGMVCGLVVAYGHDVIRCLFLAACAALGTGF